VLAAMAHIFIYRDHIVKRMLPGSDLISVFQLPCQFHDTKRPFRSGDDRAGSCPVALPAHTLRRRDSNGCLYWPMVARAAGDHRANTLNP
jgi:hypothetical protein